MYINPLYYTDTEYYNEDSFSGVPSLIIHLAKNEIYARHGYIFKDENLKNYFMGQLWYIPSVKAEEFDDSVFSDIEKGILNCLIDWILIKNKHHIFKRTRKNFSVK